MPTVGQLNYVNPIPLDPVVNGMANDTEEPAHLLRRDPLDDLIAECADSTCSSHVDLLGSGGNKDSRRSTLNLVSGTADVNPAVVRFSITQPTTMVVKSCLAASLTCIGGELGLGQYLDLPLGSLDSRLLGHLQPLDRPLH